MFSIPEATERFLPSIVITWLAMAMMASCGDLIAQEERRTPVRFDVKIENGRVAGDLKVIRVRRNDDVELTWTSDRRVVLHLHGYDIETTVEPGTPQTMSFTARAAGRFPVETHGGRHNVLLHVEVHPR